jgi:hypothetical protein
MVQVPTAPSDQPRPAPDELATQEPKPPRPQEKPAPLDAVVKRLEQRGYQAETQQWLVSMRLKDGKKIDVPVREVRARYVGDRTY